MRPTALAPFHPIVRTWFRETLGEPSPPQRAGWPAIAAGGNVLILAPTGTGKTLTAFLWELNALIVDGAKEPLANAVQILYVSPLKALGNDIQRNLESPLAALKERFEKAGKAFPEIRVAVRTGDTPASARQRMLRKSPHILITTPESLHIMLTTVRGRGMFSGVRAVIVDEIHALAGTKRGAHLALTLERLEELVDRSPQRIGLSATQRPLEEIARFLGGLSGDTRESGFGNRESAPPPDSRSSIPESRSVISDSRNFRGVTIVDCGLVKQIELAVQSPVEDLGHPEGGTIWPAVAPLVVRHVRAAHTTLVFVNNRAQAERMAARINVLAGEELALPYHGSLSRDRRLQLEGALKAGRLRALVTTSALEMGIDIGSVDLVLQLQSPKRVSTGLQRVGRAGHTLAATSRGVLVPTFRDDGMEMLAIVRGMRAGDVEPTRVVQNALDVLAQVIVAAVAIDDDWTSERLFSVVRRAYPYHALTRSAFDEVLSMLAGKYPADVAAELEARIVWDRATDTLAAARSARMVAVISGGTIPDRGYYTVNLPDRTRLGELDEEFVHETRIGDVFQLGSSTWRVNAIEHDRVIVTPAPGAPARMPFWHGELAARSAHLAPRVGELRRALDAARTIDDLETLARDYDSDHATVRSLAEYVHEQRAATKLVPDDRTVLAEQFRDETGAVRIVVHAPFGARVTAPWGMALAQRYREWFAREGRQERAARAPDGDRVTVEVQTTDDGVMLRLPQLAGDAPLEPLRGLTPEEAERRVLEEIGQSSLFGARFRMNAARALLLPRGSPRRRMPLWLQRLKAQDLLQAVREFPSFPIVVETYRDVLQDAFDMTSLAHVLRALETGSVALRTVKTELPSPFASSLQFGFVMDWMYADDTPRAERRAAILSLDRALLDELMSGAGADEPTLAIVEELAAARRGTTPGRRARSADELAILLDRAGDLSLEELEERIARGDERLIGDPIVELLERGRAIAIDVPVAGGAAARRLILTESFPRYAAAFGSDAFARVGAGRDLGPTPLAESVPAPLREPSLSRVAARRELLARWVALAATFGVDDVVRRYDLDREWVEVRLTEWTRTGRLVRGSFGDPDAVRFVSRRLLEEARRRELARLRRQVEAVDLAAYVRFLQRWQHLDPETRLSGSEGAATALRQLYGLARPAEGWERDYLPGRVEGFTVELVSRLASAGEAIWIGGTRPPSARDDAAEPPGLTTVRFVRRAGARAWLPAAPDESRLGEDARKVLGTLAYAGASFFDELASDTGLGTRRLRDALRELVAVGLATNDTLEGLRAVTRWRALPRRGDDAPDPTRWLPADFSPSPNRPVVQRRPNLRRLPKWRPPQPGESESTTWPGRWALVRTPRILGPEQDEPALAESVARQMLARYGVVARDWWRRERPAVSWGAIYRELRRLEYRGEVRRGYFVRGLAGAQFALPEAVEELRAAAPASPPAIAMATSDPANAYALPMAGDVERDALTVGRGPGAILVTIAGVPILAADGRARRVRVRADATEAQITEAARALVQRVTARHSRRRDVIVETLDGDRAAASPRAAAFLAAGFRLTTAGLRWYFT